MRKLPRGTPHIQRSTGSDLRGRRSLDVRRSRDYYRTLVGETVIGDVGSRIGRKTGFGSSPPAPPRGESRTTMKSTSSSNAKRQRPTELRSEYHFDYSKAKPNRFAGLTSPDSTAVMLDPDVAKVFKSAESVNAMLRAVIT